MYDEIYSTFYNHKNLMHTYDYFLKDSLKILYKKRKLKLFDKWVILPEIIGLDSERGYFLEMPYLITMSPTFLPDKISRVSVGFKKISKRK